MAAIARSKRDEPSKRSTPILAVSAALLLPVAVRARSATDADRAALAKTAQSARYELAIAQLTTQKATKSDIRAIAQMIVSDHDALNTQLKDLTTSQSVPMTMRMTSNDQREMTRPQVLSGIVFARAHAKVNVRINAEGKSELRKAADTIKVGGMEDPVLKMQAADAKHDAVGRALQSTLRNDRRRRTDMFVLSAGDRLWVARLAHR